MQVFDAWLNFSGKFLKGKKYIRQNDDKNDPSVLPQPLQILFIKTSLTTNICEEVDKNHKPENFLATFADVITKIIDILGLSTNLSSDIKTSLTYIGSELESVKDSVVGEDEDLKYTYSCIQQEIMFGVLTLGKH